MPRRKDAPITPKIPDWTQVLALAGETEELGPEQAFAILIGVRDLLLKTADLAPEAQMMVEGLCKVIAGQARRVIGLTEERQALNLNVQRLAGRLQEAAEINRNLETRSQTDELTGLRNQAAFLQMAPKMFQYCKSKGKKLSYAIFDLDKFKNINDTYGHAAGNFVLEEFSKILKSLRPGDFSFRTPLEEGAEEPDDAEALLARDGGEEFSLLLPNTAVEGAATLAERLRKMVAEHKFIYNHPTLGEVTLPVTVSIGVSEVDFSEAKEFAPTKGHADAALYSAKRTTRNAVVQFTKEPQADGTNFLRVTKQVEA